MLLLMFCSVSDYETHAGLQFTNDSSLNVMISLRSREDLLVRLGSVGLEFVSFRDLEIYRCSGIS